MRKEEPLFLTGDDLPDALSKKMLRTVGPMVFASCDLPAFIRLALGSMSLSMTEKNRVLDEISTLSQFQLDELHSVFIGERREFSSLLRTETPEILELGARAIIETFSLAVLRGVGYEDMALETAILRRIVRNKARRTELRQTVLAVPEKAWEKLPCAGILFAELKVHKAPSPTPRATKKKTRLVHSTSNFSF